jgi:hypothetical protein
MLMLQKVNKDVQLVESLDTGLDKMFSSIGPGDEIGLQNYRLPAADGRAASAGTTSPTAEAYPLGHRPAVRPDDPGSPAHHPGLHCDRALAAHLEGGHGRHGEELRRQDDRRREEEGIAPPQCLPAGLRTTACWRPSTRPTRAAAPSRSPLSPFGGRLINRGDQLQATDANLNVLGTTNVLDVTKNGIGTPDRADVDAAPAGTAVRAASSSLSDLPAATRSASMACTYLVSPAPAGELCGIARANSVRAVAGMECKLGLPHQRGR